MHILVITYLTKIMKSSLASPLCFLCQVLFLAANSMTISLKAWMQNRRIIPIKTRISTFAITWNGFPLFSLTILIGCLKIQLHYFTYSPKGYVAFPLTPCVYPSDLKSSKAVSTTLISLHVLPFNHISWPL